MSRPRAMDRRPCNLPESVCSIIFLQLNTAILHVMLRNIEKFCIHLIMQLEVME